MLDNALIAAIKASDTPAAISLLEQGADPNCSAEIDLYGFGAQPTTAVMLAMSWCARKDTNSGKLFGYVKEEFNEPLVRTLIEGGASLSKFSKFDEPPLCRAVSLACVETGCRELVAFMLDHGADVNELHNGCHTALHSACSNGDIDIVNLLLDRGANINPQTGYDSPLMWAVQFKLKNIVELLLVRGADVNYHTRSGETALSKAKWKRGVGKEIREMLEAARANRSAR
jgi:ankyrin repeat protein